MAAVGFHSQLRLPETSALFTPPVRGGDRSFPSCFTSPSHHLFAVFLLPGIPQQFSSFAFPGILAFFFFTQRIKLVQDTAPPLNYYWVPILVSPFLVFLGNLEAMERDS